MRENCQSWFDERGQETEPSQTGLRRRGESLVNSHRETNATAPVLDSTRISDNVGGVKHFLSTLPHALEEERHFALSEKQLPVPTKARSQSIQVRIPIRPMHLFGHNCDHDYYFRLPVKREWDAQSITRCSSTHHRDFRAVPRANRTSSIARSPILCATSSTSERPAYEPWQLWPSFVLAASSGGHTCCASLVDCAP